MASTSDFRNGLVINYNKDLYAIVEFQHVKPGKGAAFVRTKLKNLKTGRVLDNTFPAGSKIEIERVERRQYQYLYAEGDLYHFMNTETYEQTFLLKAMIDNPELLKEGTMVEILFHAATESPISCDMPAYATLEISYTEPGVKGDTATNAMKDATLETGAIIKVPLFINIGDKVKVDTRSSKYSERVKE